MADEKIAPLINPASDTWVKLRGGLNERIEKLRDDLEMPGADEYIRGEIRGLRWLISQVDMTPPEEDKEAPYN